MIGDNCRRVRERISAVSSARGVDPAGITLVAVSKNRSAEEIKEALRAGISDIAENRVQEAALKYEILRLDSSIKQPRWHLVGHLQTNKVKEAVRIFDIIHSVDSLRLAQEIDKQASRLGKRQEVLIEVKTSAEDTKSGVSPGETAVLVREASGLSNLKVSGLMTIAPLLQKAESARPYFRKLKGIFDYINSLPGTEQKLAILSMGMSDDFEAAIEEGANMVRIGRAIFG